MGTRWFTIIARHIAARGLIASASFHRSELNSFNLADDIIEPYRAIVDEYILSHLAPFHNGEQDTSLTKEDRQKIVDILNYSAIIENKKFTLKHAIERTVESFVQAIEADSTQPLFCRRLTRSVIREGEMYKFMRVVVLFDLPTGTCRKASHDAISQVFTRRRI